MADERPSYTYEQAAALIGTIRSIVLRVAVDKRRLDTALARLHGAPGGDGDAGQSAEIRATREDMAALVTHLDELGIELRDLETGLVDIPTVRDGEPAWFCWRLEDGELGYWHTTGEGFAGRRPL